MIFLHKFKILPISILIFIVLSPLAFSAPPNRPNHDKFGESKHLIDEKKENEMGRMEEVLDELADLAEEEKAKIEELEEENEHFKDELEAMGVSVEDKDDEKGGKRKTEIGMNEREPPKDDDDEEDEERRNKEEEEDPDESEEEDEPENPKKVPTNEGNGRRRMPMPRSEFNIQQTINNNSSGKITVQNNYGKGTK